MCLLTHTTRHITHHQPPHTNFLLRLHHKQKENKKDNYHQVWEDSQTVLFIYFSSITALSCEPCFFIRNPRAQKKNNSFSLLENKVNIFLFFTKTSKRLQLHNLISIQSLFRNFVFCLSFFVNRMNKQICTNITYSYYTYITICSIFYTLLRQIEKNEEITIAPSTITFSLMILDVLHSGQILATKLLVSSSHLSIPSFYPN